MANIEYRDHRTGNIYIIERSEDGGFKQGLCHIDKIGFDPIPIESMAKIPNPARDEIQKMLEARD